MSNSSDKFVFKDFVKKYNIPKDVADLLTKEHYTEVELLRRLDFGWIASQDIPSGEKTRLQIAIEDLRTPSDVSKQYGTFERFAGQFGQNTGDMGPDVKPKIPTHSGLQNPTSGVPLQIPAGGPGGVNLPPPASGFGGPAPPVPTLSTPTASAGATGPLTDNQRLLAPSIPVPTTTSLAADVKLQEALNNYLSATSQIPGFRHLLSLNQIQAQSTNTFSSFARGEKNALMIKDFLISTVNTVISHEVQELALSGNAKIVLGKPRSRRLPITQFNNGVRRIVELLCT